MRISDAQLEVLSQLQYRRVVHRDHSGGVCGARKNERDP